MVIVDLLQESNNLLLDVYQIIQTAHAYFAHSYHQSHILNKFSLIDQLLIHQSNSQLDLLLVHWDALRAHCLLPLCFSSGLPSCDTPTPS